MISENSILASQDPEIYQTIIAEAKRQAEELELIASENYASPAVLQTMGTILNNKYSEGYPGKRYYAGQKNIDIMENLAIERTKKLFGAEHVNIQPLSGCPANTAVYFATIQPGDKVLGLALDHGGHLSHGHPVNFSGILYNFVRYQTKKETGRIDMDEVRKIALKERPKMIVAGFSAYSRNLDWQKFKEIADEIGAITFADIAHIAGLIAGKQLENPVPLFDIVSTTTHKTLRGPRGALIMCKEKYAKAIDRAIFPGLQGGPHDHINAAKAVALGEALQPEFQEYSAQIIKNAKQLAASLVEYGFKILSDGTDNHLMMIDMKNSRNITGKQAEIALDNAGLSANKNMIPFDTESPMVTSGIRVGTPAVTTRHFQESEMKIIARWINEVCSDVNNSAVQKKVKAEVLELCQQFPIPGYN